MTDGRELAEALRSRSDEIARGWLAAHLAAATLRSDAEIIGELHGRSGALIRALGRALSSDAPADWSSFDHREAVQIATLMAHALAEASVSAATAAALIPSLVRACESAGAAEPMGALLPLVGVAGEAYLSARLAAEARREMAGLGRTAPILALPSGVIVVAPCGAPDREAADAVVNRTLRLILKRGVDAALVILDLSHLEVEEPEAVGALLELVDEVPGLDGACLVTGLDAGLERMARDAGRDPATLPARGSLAEALSERLRARRFSRRKLPR